MKIDKNIIKELTDYLNEFNLTEIEYTEKDTKIKVSKLTNSGSSYSSAPSSAAPALNKETIKPAVVGTEVKSPIMEMYNTPQSPELKKFMK